LSYGFDVRGVREVSERGGKRNKKEGERKKKVRNKTERKQERIGGQGDQQ